MTRSEFIQILIQRTADLIDAYQISANKSEAQVLLKDSTVLNIKLVDLTECEYNFVNLEK